MHNELSKFTISQHFIDQMPGLFVVHDTESRFLIGNKTAQKWTGLKSNDDLIGKTYHEMHCKAAEQHEEFIKQDKLILNNEGYGRILGFYCYAHNNWKAVLAEKYPLKNANGKITALVSYISDVTHTNIVDVSRFLHLATDKSPVKFQNKQSGYLIQDAFPNINLTSKQTQCLFFLLRGRVAKEIAHLLGLSARTVEHYIDAIKLKMNCATKSQMIEKAIASGYLNIIPEDLWDKFA